MRRLVSLLLIVAVAFVAGAVGANVPLDRLLGDSRVAAPTSTPITTAPPSHTATATPVAPAQVSSTPHSGPPATATATRRAVPSATPTATATATPGVPVPMSLDQTDPAGGRLALDGWTGAAGLTLHVTAPADRTDLRAEVEVRSVGQAFTDTATGSAPVSGGVASIAVHRLASGRYHWQARLVSTSGASHWYPFSHDAAAFRVQAEAPKAPAITSPTKPNGTYGGSQTVTISWSSPDDPAGISGYGYRLDLDPHGEANASVRTGLRTVTYQGLDSGTYYFHVRALDNAGNWGPSATFPFRVDASKPRFPKAIFSQFYFNPMLESLHFAYQVSKPVTVTVGIYQSDGTTRIRHIVPQGLKLPGVDQDVAWDGRDDKGHMVPAGSYYFAIRATDRFGNSYTFVRGGLNVTYKRIVVSLSQQRLWAFDGQKYVLNTLVTTGNKELPTPTGLFHVMWAKSPFTFHSPWPKGSKYYYAPSPVTYVLYFKEGGYFIHDAPWRTFYGPGSNDVDGAPGSNNTGTHGCVNVPEQTMAQLYTWATPGTAVQINP